MAKKRETRDAHDWLPTTTVYSLQKGWMRRTEDARKSQTDGRRDSRKKSRKKPKKATAEANRTSSQPPSALRLPSSRESGARDQPWSVTDGRLTSDGRPHKQKEKASQPVSQSASQSTRQTDRQTGGREAEGSRGKPADIVIIKKDERDAQKNRARFTCQTVHSLSLRKQQPLCIKSVRACARARGGRPPAQTHAPDSSIGDSGRLFGDAPTTELGLRPAAGDFLSALCPCSSPSPCCCW